MLIDSRSRFAVPTALSTAAPATAKFGEALDMSVASDLGEGHPIYLFARVSTAATSGGSATLVLQLVTADNEALTTNVEVVWQTPSFPVASLTLNARLAQVSLPYYNYRRWIGLRQVIGTAALTAGAVEAFLTTDQSAWRAYPEAAS